MEARIIETFSLSSDIWSIAKQIMSNEHYIVHEIIMFASLFFQHLNEETTTFLIKNTSYSLEVIFIINNIDIKFKHLIIWTERAMNIVHDANLIHNTNKESLFVNGKDINEIRKVAVDKLLKIKFELLRSDKGKLLFEDVYNNLMEVVSIDDNFLAYISK